MTVKTFGVITGTSGYQSHNLLEDIQGGTSGEIFHLTSAQHSVISDAVSSGMIHMPVSGGINTTGSITTRVETYDNLTTNITRTLPSVADNIGLICTFKKKDTSVFTVNIIPLGGENIDGDTTGYLLELEDEFVQLIGENATTWSVIAE